MSVCLFPILMVVWPRAFQYCAGFSGRLGLDAKSVTPEELSLISIFWGFCHQHPFSPTTPVSHSHPHLPMRLSKTHSWVLPPIQLLLCPRSQGLWILVCSVQVWNLLCPQVLLEILHSSPAGLWEGPVRSGSLGKGSDPGPPWNTSHHPPIQVTFWALCPHFHSKNTFEHVKMYPLKKKKKNLLLKI